MSESTIFELIYPLLWYWLASNHIMAYHVKEVHLKSENICGLVPLLPQTPIWQFWKVWYYVSLKKIVWYYTSLRVWYYMSLTKSVWYSISLREYDTICMILCALGVWWKKWCFCRHVGQSELVWLVWCQNIFEHEVSTTSFLFRVDLNYPLFSNAERITVIQEHAG